ncbi:MAG: hypothetical protein JO112_17025, partial [Planctomycetes bacterium]|nr:hypothetical protein [Planctomycetota bacterium]
VCDTVARECSTQVPYVVLNRYDPRLPGLSAADLQRLQPGPTVLTVANDFRGVSSSLNHGRPLCQEAPHSPVLADLRTLAETLLHRSTQPKAQAASPSMLGRLIRAFRLE